MPPCHVYAQRILCLMKSVNVRLKLMRKLNQKIEPI